MQDPNTWVVRREPHDCVASRGYHDGIPFHWYRWKSGCIAVKLLHGVTAYVLATWNVDTFTPSDKLKYVTMQVCAVLEIALMLL